MVHILLLVALIFIAKSLEPRPLLDKYGRGRIYHGVNIAYKIPPYLPSSSSFSPELSFTLQDIEYLKS